MPRTIKVASVQMDANPAALEERLDRAERIVMRAVQAGAQLVVLPELFNSGYAYTNANYQLAEPIDGITSRWLKKTAARFGIHLAGSLMLLDDSELYNSLLLFSPGGQVWRYDKNYPWAWERGYFRARRGVTVAHTELGDLGMMICWDIGHRSLWRQYAGQIDMMLIASCPPDGPNAAYRFPDGSEMTFHDLGPGMASMKDDGKRTFGDMLTQQAAWLGVPVVNSGASGHVCTHIPAGVVLAGVFLLAMPRLIKKLPQAQRMRMACDMILSCIVIDGSGRNLAKRTQADGEGYIMADVPLPLTRPIPLGGQPKTPVKRMTYLFSDTLIPLLMRPIYRNGLQQLIKKAHKAD